MTRQEYNIPPDTRSLGDLVSDFTENMSLLVRQEVQLVKVEMQQKVQALGKDVAFIAGGVVLAHMGLMALVATLIFIFANFMSAWAAAFWVTVLLLAGGGGLIYFGIKKIQALSLVPEETVRSLQEDKQWLERQIN